MKTKLTIVALLAFAAGGTCPSDVNNDGTVGINDFLAVLAAWGPCPAPTVVAMDSTFSFGLRTKVVRQWSDGTLVMLVQLNGEDWVTSQPAFSSPHTGIPIDVSIYAQGQADCFACGGGKDGQYRVIRQYADGYAENTFVYSCDLGGGDIRVRWHDWVPIPQGQIAGLCK